MQKKFLYSFMLMGIIMIGCSDNKTETPTVQETFSPCNIEIGGVKFTQSKNNAESGVTIINDTLKFVAGPQTDYFRAPDEQSTINSSPVLLTVILNLSHSPQRLNLNLPLPALTPQVYSMPMRTKHIARNCVSSRMNTEITES